MDALNTQIAASFDARAPRYAESDWHRAAAERLVDLCTLKPADRVLDAGTGTGFAALHAARQVGSDGRVVAVDISSGMLAEARRAVDASQLTNVELIHGDATALRQFGDGAFDAVICSTALIYIPVAAGLREWHRLLRQGGTIAFSTMHAGFPLAARLFRQCASEAGVELSDPCEPLGTSAACLAALEEAGFTGGEVITEDVALSQRDLDAAWESNLRSAAHQNAQRLPAEALSALEKRYRIVLAEELSADAARLVHSKMLYVTARR